MLYKIPKIKWELQEGTNEIETYHSMNTFIKYIIRVFDDGYTTVYYRSGGWRECKSFDDAKDWVENTHYPSQVRKYMDLVEKQYAKNS